MTKSNQLTERLYNQINNDPLIRDPSKILFSTEQEGFLFNKRNYLVVDGKVSNEVEYKKVGKIISQESGDVEIVNNLKVESPLF